MFFRLARVFFVSSALMIASGVASAQVTQNNMDQNADQSQGQYQPMNMGYAGFNSLGMTQSAWLDPLQNLGEGQSKPAYSKYYWSPDLVLPIRLREGMMTLINFPDWELVEDIYIGDSATFDGQISGPSTLLLYPRKGANVGVDTNIIVFGRSGNRYVFYVKSEGINTERLTNSIIDIDVIDGPAGSGGGGGVGAGGGYAGGRSGNVGNFNPGGKPHESTYTKRFQKDDWMKSIPLDPSKFRFDMEVYIPNPDDVGIAPERVWRDDIFTYIDMGEKSLNMTQRPIITLIVERVEVPVGFRSKGPNNRLIIVEAIGDMVMRNGKRMICLKMRRSDDAGLDDITYSDRGQGRTPPQWDVPAPIPGGDSGSFGSNGNDTFDGGYGSSSSNSFGGSADVPYNQTIGGARPQQQRGGSYNGAQGQGAGQMQGAAMAGDGFDYSKMQRISNNNQYPNTGSAQPAGDGGSYGYGSGFSGVGGSNISIELGTDASVEKLETLWGDLTSKYPDALNSYEPFFSVDTPADGQGKELFHLRVGPVKSLETGDNVCSRLGRNGVFCSVVRTQ